MVSLNAWLGTLDVTRTSAYMYVKQYQDELVRLGCIKVRRAPKTSRIYVVDEDCLLDFFEEKGIFLKERANV